MSELKRTETKNLESMLNRMRYTYKIELICAVLEDEIIELKKQRAAPGHQELLSEVIRLLEKRVTELTAHFHSHTKPYNGSPAG
jgi:hypothetical protein